MKIQENISLSGYTTFKIGGPARFFCIVKSEKDVLEALTFARDKQLPFFVIGGGSNLLVSDDGYRGLVIKNEIKGIEIIGDSTSQNEVILRVGAGENWDEFVDFAVSREYYGVENLSSIPGTVGASPVQNIGAYGAEAANSILSVRVFDTEKNNFVEIKNKDCDFGYRDSLFKKNKGRYLITRVDFRLKTNGNINIEYKDLQNYFAEASPRGLRLIDVRNAVIEIRKNKLPDWKTWGTAGSYFKNPVISKEQFLNLKSKYPDLPGFDDVDGIKISLGWILDKICEMKGVSSGNVGTYEKQALVLVAKPGATAEEVISFSKNIISTVKNKTGIDIEAEVEWVN